MKYAIVGSRTFNNYELLKSELDKLTDCNLIVSGGAQGTDSLAEQWAKENNIPTLVIKPDWKKYGRAAGPIRNKVIIESSDSIIAFWDGISKGTKSSIDFAKQLNKPLKTIIF